MKQKLLFIILAMIGAISCDKDFTPAECDIIYAGSGPIMRIWSIADEQDSLFLRSTSRPITAQMTNSREFATLKHRMLATVKNPENEGVGIAAPQVGIGRRLVAVQRFDKQGEPFEFYTNPEIIYKSDSVAAGGEGCLSVPEIYDDVLRSQQITIRYRDENFELREESIEGFTAVIFQHEIDHLDGRLFIDYLQ